MANLIVFSLAPNARSRSSLKTNSIIVRITEIIICNTKHPPNVLSADSTSFFPINIDALGAPPEPTSAANADTIIISGIHTPTPVKARLPTSGICPI